MKTPVQVLQSAWAAYAARPPPSRAALAWRWLVGVSTVWVAAAILHRATGPFLKDWELYGAHDWDSHSAYRYITVLSLLKYGEGPWWHPFFCGGFPAWAYSEGATNLVSPYLPFYLLLPFNVALRLELVGSLLMAWGGAYLLARRFTSSRAVSLLVAATYSINGRWALQTTAGHSWHMQYAWLPLAMWCFDRACEERSLRWAPWAGACMAMMAYQGGIYPLPHTVLLLGMWAIFMSLQTWSPRPVLTLGVVGISALGLGAPKILAVGDLMQRYPRKIDSGESVDLGMLTRMLMEPHQSFDAPPMSTSPWGWHEYGIYVGLPAVLAAVLGVIFGVGRRSNALKVCALVFFILGLGAFHPQAPWSLLHKAPLFSSQRVPTRFLQPAVLLGMLAFAAMIRDTVERKGWARSWMDLALLVPVYFVGMDLANVGRLSTEHIFNREGPPMTVAPEFHHLEKPTYNYSQPDWAGALFLSMKANEGTFKCYGIADIGAPGAMAKDNPAFRGEAYFPDGKGTATVVEWSPSSAVVEYSDAPVGARLVYNMNWDTSWTANGVPALEHERAVATSTTADKGRVTFRYYPRTLNASLVALLATLVLWWKAPRLAAWFAARRRQRAATTT